MQQSFDESYKDIADSMGITVYQRFDLNEASLFLRCHLKDLKQLLQDEKIDFIQLTEDKVEFFGYQLLAYLLNSIKVNNPYTNNQKSPDRIIRANEVQRITGLSRTTLWRMENKEEFPRRVSLGANCVGWRLSEVESWLATR